MTYKELLEEILKSISQIPEDIKVTETSDNMGILLTVDANKEDLKFIIGKQGTMIQAIRSIIRTVGMKAKASVHVKVSDPAFNSTLERNLREVK